MRQILWLKGRGVGKGRPRARGRIIKRNGKRVVAISMYTDPRYRTWKNRAIAQIKKSNLRIYLENVSLVVRCYFVNFLSSDSDNLTGSVLDALKQSGIIKDDSSKYVNASGGEFVKKRKQRNRPKQIGILVEIEPKRISGLPEHLDNFLDDLI
jgi:Holliday junction resolvase RusA-like endonuclease